MKIEASSVALQGSSSYQKTEITTVQASFIRIGAIVPADDLLEDGVVLEISDEGRASAEGVRKINSSPDFSRDWVTNIKKMILEAFLRSIGKDSTLFDPDKALRLLRDNIGEIIGGRREEPNLSPAVNGQAPPGMMRVTFEQSSFRYARVTEIQNAMRFSAGGTISTADGRTINFELELNMSQSFAEKIQFESVFQSLSIAPVFCDPLVINFNAASANLSNVKFAFDLDCDGTSDQISRLMSGSGFLALDTYGDGIIRDGDQLFGARSGDGFADLAAHDGDGNGWIDENDPIFDKLRVWVHDENGGSSLFALGELGIGAIYLGNVNTEYYLGDLSSPDGVVRKTGLFLYEDGRAGTIQHIDLAV